jgi:hypothetical protein
VFQPKLGSCMCRSVRFRALAPPEKTNVCHCRFCQQLTGSAYLVEPVFLTQNVVFEGGPISTYDHRSPTHGRTLHVHFCPSCGNTVSLTFERFPALRGMCAGTFDDPSWLVPDRHIFTESAMRWMTYPEGIACYAQHSLRLDGTPETPWQAPS